MSKKNKVGITDTLEFKESQSDTIQQTFRGTLEELDRYVNDFALETIRRNGLYIMPVDGDRYKYYVTDMIDAKDISEEDDLGGLTEQAKITSARVSETVGTITLISITEEPPLSKLVCKPFTEKCREFSITLAREIIHDFSPPGDVQTELNQFDAQHPIYTQSLEEMKDTNSEQPWNVVKNIRYDRMLVKSLHDGLNGPEIANRLNISKKTVYNRESELRNLYGKKIVPYHQKWRN